MSIALIMGVLKYLILKVKQFYCLCRETDLNTCNKIALLALHSAIVFQSAKTGFLMTKIAIRNMIVAFIKPDGTIFCHMVHILVNILQL